MNFCCSFFYWVKIFLFFWLKGETYKEHRALSGSTREKSVLPCEIEIRARIYCKKYREREKLLKCQKKITRVITQFGQIAMHCSLDFSYLVLHDVHV